MAETSPKASPKKAASKTVAAAKTKSASKAQPAEAPSAAPVTATKPAATKAASPRKTAAKPQSKSTAKTIVLSDEQRYRMVAEAAYYRAEKNQFKSDPLRDWIDAENDINALLNGEQK